MIASCSPLNKGLVSLVLRGKSLEFDQGLGEIYDWLEKICQESQLTGRKDKQDGTNDVEYQHNKEKEMADKIDDNIGDAISPNPCTDLQGTDKKRGSKISSLKTLKSNPDVAISKTKQTESPDKPADIAARPIISKVEGKNTTKEAGRRNIKIESTQFNHKTQMGTTEKRATVSHNHHSTTVRKRESPKYSHFKPSNIVPTSCAKQKLNQKPNSPKSRVVNDKSRMPDQRSSPVSEKAFTRSQRRKVTPSHTKTVFDRDLMHPPDNDCKPLVVDSRASAGRVIEDPTQVRCGTITEKKQTRNGWNEEANATKTENCVQFISEKDHYCVTITASELARMRALLATRWERMHAVHLDVASSCATLCVWRAPPDDGNLMYYISSSMNNVGIYEED